MEGRRLRTAVGVVRLLATALLASCGGGGGGSGAGGGGPAITGNFFPLDSGARWFYAAAGAGSSSAVQVVPATAGGMSGTLVETVDEASGSVIDQAVYAVAADGVRQYSLSAGDPITAALNGLQVLRYPLQTGDSYVLLETTIDLGDVDGDGRNERLSLRVETTVVGLESVTTAAGAFTGALHQRQVIRQSVNPTGGGGTVSATVTLDTWYGRDVGPVQTTVRIVAPGVDETVTDGLTAYGVGDRRSETVAPTVPADDAGPGAGALAQCSGECGVQRGDRSCATSVPRRCPCAMPPARRSPAASRCREPRPDSRRPCCRGPAARTR